MDELISRRAAIDAVNAYLGLSAVSRTIQNMTSIQEILENLPSAEPRKKGKWIGKEQFANSPEFYSWQCSVCGCVLEDPTLDKPYPFCPICGSHNAEEEGEQE